MTTLKTATPVSFVNVADRARAIAFYIDTLGLELKSTDGFGDFITAGPALIRLTALPDYKASPYPMLGWHVPDIVATAKALKAKGVTLTIYEGMGQDDLGIWTAPDGDAKVAWFADPDGNVLSLTQS